jgi:hypothetical protein
MLAVAPQIAQLSGRDQALVLRDLVCRAVDELRASGRTFTRVSRLVTRLAAEAGLDEVRDRLAREQLVAWCAQRYYGP